MSGKLKEMTGEKREKGHSYVDGANEVVKGRREEIDGK